MYNFGHFWDETLSVIERCPHSRGVQEETLDCKTKMMIYKI